MSRKFKTIVVGTTPDYIEAIHNRYPERALFLVDKTFRSAAALKRIDEASILFCNFEMADLVARPLDNHLQRYRLTVTGITCFDCEWLPLTAWLAERKGLPYPSLDAVKRSRDKHETKTVLRAHNLDCPRSIVARRIEEATEFASQIECPVILKPLSGSGSELVFLAKDNSEIEPGYEKIRSGLKLRSESPMYRRKMNSRTDDLWQRAIAVEEYIGGDEYSCDAILDKQEAELIRVTRKYPLESPVFGTTSIYTVPAEIPVEGGNEALADVVARAARAMQLDRCTCMFDFKIYDGKIFILELTPRVGGDCLPQLIEQSCGLYTPGIALDLAEGKPITIPTREYWIELAAVRFFAGSRGKIESINSEDVLADERVREVYLKSESGHKVHLPPYDYSSWILGHAIFEPNRTEEVRQQAEQIGKKLSIKMEPFHADRIDGRHKAAAESA